MDRSAARLFALATIYRPSVKCPVARFGGWNLSRFADLSLAQTAYQLANEKRIWLPAMNKSETTNIPMSTVMTIGEIGPLPRGHQRQHFKWRSQRALRHFPIKAEQRADLSCALGP